MRLHSSMAFLGLLGVGLPAWSSTDYRDEPTLWAGEVQLAGVGEVDRQTPAGASLPVTHTGDVSGTLTCGFFLHPLVDESGGPLALLGFYQHPGELSISVGKSATLTDPTAGWTEDTSGFSLGARLEVYLWHQTGILASASGDLGGASGYYLGGESADYALGLVHYFRPNLRAELVYVGSVSHSSSTQSGPVPVATQGQDSLAATNAGRAQVVAVLLDDRLSVEGRVQVGQLTSDLTELPSGSDVFYTQGVTFDARVLATGYFGRQLSGSIAGGLEGQSTTTQLIQTSTGPAESATALAPLVGLGVQYFVIDPVFAQLGYQVSFPRVRSSKEVQSDSVDQVVSLSLVARL